MIMIMQIKIFLYQKIKNFYRQKKKFKMLCNLKKIQIKITLIKKLKNNNKIKILNKNQKIIKSSR